VCFLRRFDVAICAQNTTLLHSYINSMTVAHPPKYFTSTPKKLIQLELMLFGAAVIGVIDICVFSQAFCLCCYLCAKRHFAAQLHQQAV